MRVHSNVPNLDNIKESAFLVCFIHGFICSCAISNPMKIHSFIHLSPAMPSCPRSSSWVPQGSYLASNRDECTVSLVYSVHLKKQGSVTFEYQYPDNNLLFEFFVSRKCTHFVHRPLRSRVAMDFYEGQMGQLVC